MRVEELDESKLPWAKSANTIATQLSTNPKSGLGQSAVADRREQFGPNRLPDKGKTTVSQIVWRQFKDVLIGILFVAAAISFFAGETTDSIAILAIIMLNAILGFVQEWKAEQALLALRNMLSPQCEVVRSGREQTIPAEELVPGDIVIIETGDRIPADLRLWDTVDLRIDESALTGESLAVSKTTDPLADDTPLAERSCMLWTGTAATNGRALGIVVATGSDTEFGRIARMTSEVSTEETPLQRKLAKLGRQLGVMAIGVSAFLFIVGWFSGKPLLEMFLTSVSLAVAVVPEGLPAVVTLTMALGIRAMVRRRALLRRLQAAEGLGSATVICTDKTGTLTQNEMTVTKIWLPTDEIEVTGVGYDPAGHFEQEGQRLDYLQRPDLRHFLKAASHCNHATISKESNGEWIPHGEPTEAALVVAAYKAWLPIDRPDFLAEYSFNSERKRMSVVERNGKGIVAFSKGAPDVLLDRCRFIKDGDSRRIMTDEDRHRIEAALHRFAGQGLRTLAITERPLDGMNNIDEETVEHEMTFLGVVGMLDPPRPQVPQAVAIAKEAGIRIVMITGDSADTAAAIAKQVGIDAATAITGNQLTELSDEQLLSALQTDVVFARTTPEHKLRIVRLLQNSGEVTAMTGDGVNDAPALKKADVGIAMGNRGTDVAKNAADIVLTDDNFDSIVGAVEEGRRQYDNIQKFVRYLLSSNTGEIVAIAGNIALGGPLILLPVQILWMNLVTDGITAVALGVEPAERSVMKRPPRDPNSRILDRFGLIWILVLGIYMGAVCLFLFNWYLASEAADLLRAQTVAFTGLIVVEKANVLNFRSLRDSVIRLKPLSNPYVYLAMISMILLQIAAVHVPLLQGWLHTTAITWQDWGVIFLFALPIVLLGEVLKVCTRNRKRSR